MIFRKKKKMIDVRELQKRGVVRIPNKDVVVPTNREGFVELGADSKVIVSETTSPTPTTETPSSNTEFFGFMNNSEEQSSTSDSFSTQSDGYNRREVDEKMTELDNKVYKLEQRIELLERKLEVGQSSEPSTGAMGW
jgi:hypothetical protein